MRWSTLLWLSLILVTASCESEPEDSPENQEGVNDAESLELEGISDAETDDAATDIGEAGEEDISDGSPVDSTDTEESVEDLYACPEVITTSLPGGAGLLYNCISNAEGLPYQVIRQIRSGEEEIVTRVEIVSPERLGSDIKIRGEFAYFSTVTIEDELVTARTIYRLNLEAGDAELVRQFTADSFAEVGVEPAFNQISGELMMMLQPEGERIAFHFVTATSQVQKGTLYSFSEGDDTLLDALVLGSEGSVRRAQWNLDGSKIIYTAGGTLAWAGADLSGKQTLDNQINSTSVSPNELKSGVYVYAGQKLAVRVLTDSGSGQGAGDKDDYPFDKEIDDIFPLSESEVIVWASDLYHLNLQSGATTSLGKVPGFGEHPVTISPEREGFIVGGSIDNPYRSFEYHYISADGETADLIVGTTKGAGYVTSGAVWY